MKPEQTAEGIEPKTEHELFIISLIDKWSEHKQKLSENLDLYKRIEREKEYDITFSNWNITSIILFDLEDILCRFNPDSQLAQYKAKVIAELEAEAKELECKSIYGAYRRCINVIQNS